MALASVPVYAVTLFLALCSLLKWAHRRHRLTRNYRRTVAEALEVENQTGRPFLVC